MNTTSVSISVKGKNISLSQLEIDLLGKYDKANSKAIFFEEKTLIEFKTSNEDLETKGLLDKGNFSYWSSMKGHLAIKKLKERKKILLN